ncbi:MAG: cytochrome P460 family protein [Proteobacteria bacterium]|nr:cytochrome P460 family protein [Pseudomonadota bacterium]
MRASETSNQGRDKTAFGIIVDGSTLVKLAWNRTPSAELASATVAGPATTVLIMVRDSKRFTKSRGLGFGRFLSC